MHSSSGASSSRGAGSSQRSAADAAPLDDAAGGESVRRLRESAEYRAAWDVELWKAVQADRFRQQLERQRARAMGDLAKTVKERERAAAEAVARRTADVAAAEGRLEKERRALAEREVRLGEAERGVRRMRQQLLDAQRRVEDEVRAQARRANEDIGHRALLLQERVKAAEAQAQRADERQRQAQADYLELYEEFHRFRTAQLTGGGEAAARAGEDVESRLLRARLEHQEEMRLQRERLEQQHREELADATRRCRDLEAQNQRLTAALARRRAQLQLLRCGSEPAATTTTTTTASSSGSGEGAKAGRAAQAAAAAPDGIAVELARLRREREHLVVESAGAMDGSDPLVQRLDARIRELAGVLDDVAAAGGH